MAMTVSCLLQSVRKSSLSNSSVLIIWNNSSRCHYNSNSHKTSPKCATRWPNSERRSPPSPFTKTSTDCKTCKRSNKSDKRQRRHPHQSTSTHTPNCTCCTAKTTTFFSKNTVRRKQEWKKIFWKWATRCLSMRKSTSSVWSTEQLVVRYKFGTDLHCIFRYFLKSLNFLNLLMPHQIAHIKSTKYHPTDRINYWPESYAAFRLVQVAFIRFRLVLVAFCLRVLVSWLHHFLWQLFGR